MEDANETPLEPSNPKAYTKSKSISPTSPKTSKNTPKTFKPQPLNPNLNESNLKKPTVGRTIQRAKRGYSNEDLVWTPMIKHLGTYIRDPVKEKRKREAQTKPNTSKAKSKSTTNTSSSQSSSRVFQDPYRIEY